MNHKLRNNSNYSRLTGETAATCPPVMEKSNKSISFSTLGDRNCFNLRIPSRNARKSRRNLYNEGMPRLVDVQYTICNSSDADLGNGVWLIFGPVNAIIRMMQDGESEERTTEKNIRWKCKKSGASRRWYKCDVSSRPLRVRVFDREQTSLKRQRRGL